MTTPRGETGHRRLPWAVWVIAGALVLVLVATAGRYGFHRDEYYFIEGGRHLAWAQPDNPMLIPLLATGWHDLVGGHLWLFRIPPALAAAATAVLAACTARELGGRPRDQTTAAILTGTTGIVLGTGHLFSITTFDITLTALVLFLIIRALRLAGRIGPWLLVGLAAGVATEIKLLVVLVLACCLAGLLIIGPRHALRTAGPWLAALVALVLAAPQLVWQTVHGWPMLEVAASIAAGGSTSSAERALVIPLHLLMAGVVAGPVLVIGVVVLLRSTALRPWRWVAVAFVLMIIVVVATGGKPYYLAGFSPALIAAGTRPVVDWATTGRTRLVPALGVAAVLTLPNFVFSLPLAPAGSTVYGIATSVNPDGAETVGWPDYIAAVDEVVAELDSERGDVIILTDNYGEAGALTRERRRAPDADERLPPVYSGHNAFGAWGPPPAGARTAVVVGDFDAAELDSWFADCTVRAEVSSPPGVENEETDAPIRVCTLGDRPWADLWPEIRRLG